MIKLLERERGRLEALARALLERETLDQPEAYKVAGVELSETETGEEARAAGATTAMKRGPEVTARQPKIDPENMPAPAEASLRPTS